MNVCGFALLVVLCALCMAWVYWRFIWFFRDPDRAVPKGNNVVSPADGEIVYVKRIKKGVVPISVKRGRKISLKDDIKEKSSGDKYLIGVFMSPFSVHVNRAPIAGKVDHVKHYNHNNLAMTIMWFRTLLNIRPFYKYSHHMWVNERNVVLIKGKFPVYVVQIADLAVNKVVCWVKKGSKVKKGQRFGMIKMGSQVDVVLPANKVKVLVKEGDKVRAGESVLAKII